MANLLDQASIVLTPTAYDDGKVLCAKPSEAPYGDFDFSRNSAATRVNAQGLVENVQILSSNLVQNGDFSEEGVQEVSNGSFSQEGSELVVNGDFATDSDWTADYGASQSDITISNGELSFISSATYGFAKQQINVTSGKIYKITADIKSFSGSMRLFSSSGNAAKTINSTGIITNYFTPIDATTLIGFSANNDIGASVVCNSISCVEVGQNWTLGTGWSIGEDKANGDGSGTAYSIALQSLPISALSGNTVKLEYTISNYVSGSVRPTLGVVNGLERNSNGTFIEYIKLGSNAPSLQLVNRATALNGSITNISVKEVGQNWSFVNADISIGNDGLEIISKGGNRPQANQNISGLTIGNKYKLSAVAKRGNCVEPVEIEIAGINSPVQTNKNNTTEFANIFYEFIATSTIHTIQAKIDDGTSTIGETAFFKSVSLIEITDDTNLPRINYEGFSYQDALGSEEVVNGTFDDGLNGWSPHAGSTLELENGMAKVTTVGGQGFIKRTDLSIETGKTYFCKAYITNGLSPQWFINSVNNPINLSLISENTYGGYVTTNGNNPYFYIRGNNTDGEVSYIDNVSVKEYLGQEVVPDSGCGHWLWEPQSTNLITQSELFSDSSWLRVGSITTTDNYTTSPSGQNNGTRLQWTNATNYIYQSLSHVGSDFTLSIYLKSNTNVSQQVRLFMDNGAQAQDVVVTTQWQRFELTNTTTPTQSNRNVGLIKSGGQVGDLDISIWGAQFEALSYPTSLIPTSGSTVTRNQDVCTNGGSLSSINSTSGVLYFEAKSDNLNVGSISINDGTISNRITARFRSDLSKIQLSILGSTDDFNLNSDAITLSDYNKIAIVYNNGDYYFFINGVKGNVESRGTFSANTFTQLDFNRGGGAEPFFGKTKCLAVWKEALSDQELADLTYPTPTDPTFALDFDTIATDFTFARGSEATYVDAQGLIQSTNEIGSELITNGDFANWTNDNPDDYLVLNENANNYVTESNGQLRMVSDNSATIAIRPEPTNMLTAGKIYKVSVDLTFTSGTINISGVLFNTSGTKVFYLTAPSSYLQIAKSSALDVLIDNVSVKEVITATNTPRLDYSTGAEAFLLEPQSTNLIPYSEDFSDASWTKFGNTVVTPNTVISPDGTLNASTVTGLSGTGSNDLRYVKSGSTANNTYTYSVYLKGSGTVRIQLSNGIDQGFDSNITLTSDWKRHSLTSTFNATVTPNLTANLDDLNGQTATTYDIWGAQLEQQSYATSYIPTSGTSVTRNQETCINATPEINSEEGVLYAEIAALVDEGHKYISLSDGTTLNRVTIELYPQPNILVARLTSNNVQQAFLVATNINKENYNKIAIKYKENNCSFWVNGVKIATDTSVVTPIGLSKLSFNDGGGTKFFGNTKDVQVYTKALSDAELIKLTT